MSGFRLFKQHHGSRRTAPLSKTAEREFEREVKKLEQLEEDCKKIYKTTKRSMECMTGQTKAESKLVQNLYNCGLTREDRRLHMLTDSWFQSSQQLDLLSQEMNSTMSKTVAEPMKKFGTIFPSLQQAMKKREQALQELAKAQARLDKYSERERTGPNIVKLDASRKDHTKAKAEFDTWNGPLVEDMPKLYEGRVDYFQPSLRALIVAQLKYLTEAHKVYTLLSATIAPESLPEMSSPFDDDEDEAEKPDKVQQKLAEIRALSITADD